MDNKYGTYITPEKIIELFKQGCTIDYIANLCAGTEKKDKREEKAMVEKIIYENHMSEMKK